jgi:hypothetical protein
MALSNAERQARYRQRHLKSVDGEKVRLSLFLDLYARLQLERIARHEGCTVTGLIEKWAAKAEQRVVGRMTPKEEHVYYASDVTP